MILVSILCGKRGLWGYRIVVGGRAWAYAIIGTELVEFLPKADLLPYLEAVLHIYNRYGRRDNKYKARIKILVQELGIEKMRAEIDAYFAATRGDFAGVPDAMLGAIEAAFQPLI